MDPAVLARLQFAMTIGFHFIFPPLTIGLAWMLAVVEWLGWRKRDAVYDQMARFYARLFGLTFAMGVATGVVMEFQFGTNWASYSRFVGDIFGAPLAAEAVFAFFLESAFAGLYLVGRDRVSRGTQFFAALMVAVGATLSAFWILVANSWQQTPAGFVVKNGRAELVSFAEAVFNPSTMVRFFHTLDAALIAGAFFMAGVAALLLLRRQGEAVAKRALPLALVAAAVMAVLEVVPFGHMHAQQVARTQPEKFAALEGVYTPGQKAAPMTIFGIPTFPPPGMLGRIEIPKMLSWMAFGDADAVVRGLPDFPEDRVAKGVELWLSFVSFHNMVMLGFAFVGITALGLLLLWRRKLFTTAWYLKILVLAAPLPVAACEFGWIAAEVGRQPWIVYGMLRTRDAISPTVAAGEVLFSLLLFGTLYLLLGVVWVYLLWREVRRGPVALPAPATKPSEEVA